MDDFFTHDEREDIRTSYLAAAKKTLEVFNSIDDSKLESLLSSYDEEHGSAIDYLDVTLRYLSGQRKDDLNDPNNRTRLINLIKRWTNLTQLDIRISEPYLEMEFGLRPGSEKTSINQAFSNAEEKITLVEDYERIKDKFPFLVTGYQMSHILTLSKDGLKTIKPQCDFLDSLSISDIGKGNIDYNKINELNKYYSAFSPTFLTLLDTRNIDLPENYSYFPIVNSCFPGVNRMDFKGIVEVIPDETLNLVSSIDPRFYQYSREGVIIKNMLTCSIMGLENRSELVESIVSSLNEEDFDGLFLELDSNHLMNIGMLLNDYKIKKLTYSTNDDKLTKDQSKELLSMINNKKQTIKDAAKNAAKNSYLTVKSSTLDDIASDLSESSFLVAFRHARKELGYKKRADSQKQLNPNLSMIDINSMSGVLTPALGLYQMTSENDFDVIMKQGPRKMENGKKFFSENKEFFSKLKQDPDSLNIIDKYHMAKEIQKHMNDKEFKLFIEDAIAGIDNLDKKFMTGYSNPDIMHYLSKRNKPFILIEELNGLKPGDLMLGYAMNNCVNAINMTRYHMSNDARIYTMWLNGLKVGMSYDLMITGPNTIKGKKDPLIDSIELSDDFFKEINKNFESCNQEKIPDSYFAKNLAYTYLFTRVNHSENGLYIVPESNNFHVIEAMNDFITEYKGMHVLKYDGLQVKTDTDFTKMPYWIDRENVIKETYTRLVDENGTKLDPNKINDQNSSSPLYTDETNSFMNQQLKRMLNQ